jgi:hypothetical protein
VKIIDMHWSPGTPIYSILCACGTEVTCAADLKGRVKCHNCGREANLHTLLREWENKPPPSREAPEEKPEEKT